MTAPRKALAPSFSSLEFRAALGMFPTGVTIVTARDARGHRVGLTASSFNSVSLDPPLVLWSLSLASPNLEAFSKASHFAVNVLAADQQALSSGPADGGEPADEASVAMPATLPAELAEALDDGEEMAAGELPHPAGKVCGTVGQQDLGLAVSAGVEEDLAGRRIAGGILEPHVEPEVSQRDPAGLAAPARVDELLPVREEPPELKTRLRCPFVFHEGGELE